MTRVQCREAAPALRAAAQRVVDRRGAFLIRKRVVLITARAG